MPFVPSQRLVLLAVLPLLLGAVSALEPSFVWPMLLADLALALVAANRCVARPARAFPSRTRAAAHLLGGAAEPGQTAPLFHRAKAAGRAGERRLGGWPGYRGIAQDRAGARHRTRPGHLPREAEPPRALRAWRSPPALGHPARLWWRQIRIASRAPGARGIPTCRPCVPTRCWLGKAWKTAWCARLRLRGGENEFEALRDYQRDDGLSRHRLEGDRAAAETHHTRVSARTQSIGAVHARLWPTDEPRKPRGYRSSITRSMPC